MGEHTGAELARIYASADVFVFPSRTDTFGIVLLEALASGVPVAAYPVTGPIDVLSDGIGGVLSDDLRTAALAALDIDRGGGAPEGARLQLGGLRGAFPEACSSGSRRIGAIAPSEATCRTPCGCQSRTIQNRCHPALPPRDNDAPRALTNICPPA